MSERRDTNGGDAAGFIGAHPRIRAVMDASPAFAEIKSEARLEIDDEVLYIVKGDMLGEEEELFVESVIEGAAGQGRLNRRVFEALEAADRDAVVRRFSR